MFEMVHKNGDAQEKRNTSTDEKRRKIQVGLTPRDPLHRGWGFSREPKCPWETQTRA